MVVKNGIKSKERVAKFGEVFTPEHIVNDMLDLVKDESYRIESKFMEPACGDGNFLVEILRRKLETAAKLGLDAYDRNVFVAVASIYAIDIQSDNVREAKQRLVDILEEEYEKITSVGIGEELLKALKYVMDRNILHGNSLNGSYGENENPGTLVLTEYCMDGDIVTMKESYLNNAHFKGVNKEHEKVSFSSIHSMRCVEEHRTEEQEEMMI